MSLIFITSWVREIHKRYKLPWDDEVGRCEEDPKWTCAAALNNFYKYTTVKRNYIEPIPPYMTSVDSILKRYRGRRGYNLWQCTEINSVNNRIRIYK